MGLITGTYTKEVRARQYELPREKLERQGAKALSDKELLHLVIGTGSRDLPVERIARRISRLITKERQIPSLEQLTALRGVGIAKAAQVIAALEFARRLRDSTSLTPHRTRAVIDTYFLNESQCAFVLFDGSERSIYQGVVGCGESSVAFRSIAAAIITHKAAGLYAAMRDVTTAEPPITLFELAYALRTTCDWLGMALYGLRITTREGSIEL